MDYSGGDNRNKNAIPIPDGMGDLTIEQEKRNPNDLGNKAMAAEGAPQNNLGASESNTEEDVIIPLSMPPESKENESNGITQNDNNTEDTSIIPTSDADAVKQAIEITDELINDSEKFFEKVVGLRNVGEKPEGEK